MVSKIGLLLAATLIPAAAPGADLVLPPAIQDAFRIGGANNMQLRAMGFDKAGNIFLAGETSAPGLPTNEKTRIGPCGGTTDLFVIKVSFLTNEVVYATEIGGKYFDSLQAMAVDSEGSVYLAGDTAKGSDVPTTEGSFLPKSETSTGYVLKLDPSGKRLVYSTYLDENGWTTITALAVDGAGNLYVGGTTTGVSFRTTAGAFRPDKPEGSHMGFIAKLSADGSALLASTFLFGRGWVAGLALGPEGLLHIVGPASGDALFTTPDAPYPAGSNCCEGLYLARINSSLSRLVYSTQVKGSNSSVPGILVDEKGSSFVTVPSYPSTVQKFDAAGVVAYEKTFNARFLSSLILEDSSVLIGGSNTQANFPTRDTLFPCMNNIFPGTNRYNTDGVLLQLGRAGEMIHSSYEAGRITAMGRAANGSIYLAGQNLESWFPGGRNLLSDSGLGEVFVFRLDLDRLVRGRPAPACLTQLVDPSAPAATVPGSFTILFGSNLGPSAGTPFQLDPGGNVPTALAEVSVTVGGIAAPLLYVQDEQINFLVPQGVAAGTTEICVTTAAGRACLVAGVSELKPAVFRDEQLRYAVLNQDWSLNTQENPAARGSFVSIWGAGMGPYARTVPDGSIAELPLNRLALPVSAFFQDPFPPMCRGTGFMDPDYPCPRPPVQGEVTFAGAAPQLVNGVTQVNVRIPEDAIPALSAPLRLVIGTGENSYYRDYADLRVSIK